jgi:beta-glucosidase
MSPEEKIAQLGDSAPAIPRLGITKYGWWNEGLHGSARDGVATVFPQAIGLAATWDADLVQSVGDVVSTEARANYNLHADEGPDRYAGLTIWSPNINIFRDPRWGRGQETYGEDPFLTSVLGMNFVRGIQGGDAFYRKADATPKHFAVHSGPEEGRDAFDAKVSAHDLEDTYLVAFHSLITKSHADAMMCSYNAINGVPSCANDNLLQKRVRDGWGFKGYVVSDCDAVGNVTTYHHYTADQAHGTAATLRAGTDLDCGRSYRFLNDALKQGLVTEKDIDVSLRRLLMAKLHLGMMQPKNCTPYNAITMAEIGTSAHDALALKAAQESIVLLKNDNVLPLRDTVKKIAVIGASADMVTVLEANYHGTAARPVTPLQGLQAKFTNVRYAQGATLAEGTTVPIPGTALRTSQQGNEMGLRAEYFDHDALTGEPRLTRTERHVDFDWEKASPQGITSEKYAVRWSGAIVPPGAGDYTLEVRVDPCDECRTGDPFALWIDGKQVLAGDGVKARKNRATLNFKDTKPHALRLEVTHTGGGAVVQMNWIAPAEVQLEEAARVAANADVVLVFAGLSADLEREAGNDIVKGFKGGDRVVLGLPDSQERLLEKIAQAHKPTVLVMMAGSAVSLSDQERETDAILEAWYPGQSGGTALAQILAGDVSPSGRLPITIYRDAADLPDLADYAMKNRTYRYFKGPVEYPFGFGLSYAKFTYSPVRMANNGVKAGNELFARFTIRNESDIAADEVAEMYIIPTKQEGAPKQWLVGMHRLSLRPHEIREVRVRVVPEWLSTVDAQGIRAVRAGQYTLFVGSSQPHALAVGKRVRFTVTGEKDLTF